MENRILGLHHITAIAGNAQRNFDFYTKVLGLRMVKKTVNFDDPGTYHFYYGDETGSPGTILTFFPWEGMKRGTTGPGMATEIGYAVPQNSLPFWKKRFEQHKVDHDAVTERLGNQVLPFRDPDGLNLALVVPQQPDIRKSWFTEEVPETAALHGFHDVTLTVHRIEPTARILTDIFEYRLQAEENGRMRFVTDAIAYSNNIDLVTAANKEPGYGAAGTNHHIAFRVRDENTLMTFREKVLAKGLNITPRIDRNYFYSLYFREPGGVLFEIATDNPGFLIDEPVSELGTHLMLPAQYEKHRREIEQHLPAIA